MATHMRVEIGVQRLSPEQSAINSTTRVEGNAFVTTFTWNIPGLVLVLPALPATVKEET